MTRIAEQGTRCRDCGAFIVWAKRDDGQGWHPPLEAVRVGPDSHPQRSPRERLKQVDRGVAVTLEITSQVYQRHYCRDEDLAAQALEVEAGRAAVESRIEDQRRQVERAEGFYELGQEDRRRYVAALTDYRWRVAMQQTCPKCDAAPRVRCVNLTDVRLGREPARPKQEPHMQRYPEGKPPVFSHQDWMDLPQASARRVE